MTHSAQAVSEPPPITIADRAGQPRRHSLIRFLPVGRRLFLIVVLNAVVILVLGAMIWGGGELIARQWDEVRRVREFDRQFVRIDSDVGRLQSLIHRYFNAPTDEVLAEIARRRAEVLDRLEAARRPNDAFAQEISQLVETSRQFLDGFDALKDMTARLRQAYDESILRTAGELSGLYAILDNAAHNTPGALIWPSLSQSRKAFSATLLAIDAFYLGGDRAAADIARGHLETIATTIPVMLDLAVDDLQLAALRALAERSQVMDRGLTTLVEDFEAQSRLLVERIDGGQAAMADQIDRLIAQARMREADAQGRFGEVLAGIGTAVAAIGVGFLTISILASWLIGKSIGGPLRELMEEMTAIAGGDYERPIAGVKVPDEIGAMARALAVFKDTAIDQRRIEQERAIHERRWRRILEGSPIGISIVTRDGGSRLYSNPEYDRLFGHADHAQVLSESVTDSFLTPADFGKIFDAAARDGQISGLEIQRRRLDGSVWWCQLDLRPIDFDGRDVYIVWHYDVTVRRLQQEELRAAKERAEAALIDLRNAHQSLIQAEKLASLGGLVAGIAHEINTPVGTTLTAASLLADETTAIVRLNEAGKIRRSDFLRYVELAKEVSDRISTNCFRAAELIQSFKQVAVDQTSDERRPFNLADYIHEIMVSLGPRLKKTALKVVVNCPESIILNGYPGLFAQVLTNFVINSIMHGYPAGAVGTLWITVDQPAPGEIELVYRDDGRGIPAEYLPKIFDPFFTTNRQGGGTGLGLNIVYNIVLQKLKGRLTVASNPGDGATFTLRFPIEPV